MEMPKPSEVHKKLQQIVGQWVGEEQMPPSQWAPSGSTATGYVDNRVALDGFTVIQEYEQKNGDTTLFRGHGVFTWNPQEQCYILYWFDTMGGIVNIMKGNFDNNRFSLKGTTQQGMNRCSWDCSQKSRLTFRMETSMDGKQWQTMMDGSYTKKG